VFGRSRSLRHAGSCRGECGRWPRHLHVSVWRGVRALAHARRASNPLPSLSTPTRAMDDGLNAETVVPALIAEIRESRVMTQTAYSAETPAPMSPDSPAADDPDPIEPAARFVAEQKGGFGRILSQHKRRPDGRCAECSARELVTWPCTLVNIAHRARMISGGGSRRRQRPPQILAIPPESPVNGRCR